MSDARDISSLTPEQKRALLAELLKKKADEGVEWPLSQGQRALWFLYRLNTAAGAYNIGPAVRVSGPIDVPALKRALDAIVRRHGPLRATFPSHDGAPRQIIHAQIDLPFERIELSGWSEADLRARVAEHHAKPFDLEKGPACRMVLFSLSERDHVLLLTMHHIVSDGASVWILLEEINRAYAAEVAGAAAPLPPLPCEYRDYVAWQESKLAAEGEPLEQFWTTALSGRLPVLELPTDYPRPSFQRFKGATVSFSIEPPMVDALEQLARSERVTLFVVMLAAFYTLLSRYSGQTDLIVGTPALGRSRPEFERLVGYFVNPIALRASLDDDPTFRAFLKQVRTIVQGGVAHQDYPFGLLVERLHPDRDPARSPVFQTMFNLIKVPGATGRGSEPGALPMAPFPVAEGEGQFDLSLEMLDANGQHTAELRYDTDLFAAATAERMAGHYRTLLAGALRSPDLKVSELPLLDAPERCQIVEEWNATERPYDQAEGVEAMIDAQARRSPDAVAVKGADRQLTYGDLRERSDQLASWLASRSVGSGVLVGVCLQRTTDLLVALCGVLKSGAAYVPLDPGFPPARLKHMVEDSRLTAIITDSESEDALPESGAEIFRIDRDRITIAAHEKTAAPGPFDPESLAYVLYTSGSTGRPKGVQIPRRALTNFIRAMQHRPGIQTSDVLVAVTTLSFDIAGLELYLPLSVGARVVVATSEQARDGAELRELVEGSGATMMQATPATWRMLIDAGWRGAPTFTILCGGEPLPRQLAPQLIERAGAVWNMYGPTETTIWSTVAPVTTDAPITVGRPIGNTQVYIVDKQMQPVPVGAAGELCIGGDGVALGYLGRLELTEERFVRNPFASSSESRVYRTGDLARWLPDGRIDCLGRRDQQVKVRGFRIELAEIEAVLERHPEVREAVVSVHEEAGDRRLVGYVVFQPGGDATASELRKFARRELPDYMVPSLFVVLERLPLTPNGKVDRLALPAPLAVRRGLHERVAPRTPMEQLVADVWSEVLGRTDLSVHDNFFEVGGHSLISMQANARIEKRLGVRLDPARFMLDTLEQISARCEQLAGQATAAPEQG